MIYCIRCNALKPFRYSYHLIDKDFIAIQEKMQEMEMKLAALEKKKNAQV